MGEKKKIYKSENSKTIYEFLKKKDEECEEWLRFSSALKRELVNKYHLEEKLLKCEEELKYYKKMEENCK